MEKEAWERLQETKRKVYEQTEAVHEKDYFKSETICGVTRLLEHKPAVGNRGYIVAYYAHGKTKDGTAVFYVMTTDEIEKYKRNRSESWKLSSSPWQKDFEFMARNTVLKALKKKYPFLVELKENKEKDIFEKKPIKGLSNFKVNKDQVIGFQMFLETVKQIEGETPLLMVTKNFIRDLLKEGEDVGEL